MVMFDGGRIRIDARARVVLVDGQTAKLGGRAFDVLEALIHRSNRVVSKQELLDLVWRGLIVEENNLQVHVMNLRKLLGAESIVTVPGRGYQFTLVEDGSPGIAGAETAHNERDRQTSTSEAPRRVETLIGRDELIASTSALVRRRDVRIVALSGAGGCGKTRVALRVTAELADDFEDGAYMVMLAPVRDVAHVAWAIADVLKVQEFGGRALEDLLAAYLRERSVLLTMDNFEHVLAAMPVVTRLVAQCPRLKIVITTRVLVRVSDVHHVMVPPLAVPAMGACVKDALQAPAVRLFNERAMQAGHRGCESHSDVAAAAEICQRLDGLPLAIELAAARLRVLTPVALARRLSKRFSLLKATRSDVPHRQRTLRDAIAWSHDLLDTEERQLFRRLAVFVGDWTLGAAEAIAGADGSTQRVLELVSSLMDHNLVLRVEDLADEPRFTMLETVREFAVEQLETSSEAHELHALHAQYYIRLAESLELRLRSAGRAPALVCMRAEYNNIRAALSWVVIEQEDTVLALRLTGALPWYWYFAAQFSEGRGWIKLALELPGADALEAAHAKVLSGAARLAFYAGALNEALELASRSVALFREMRDRSALGLALFHLGIPKIVAGDFEGARACFAESTQCFRELGDDWGIALAVTYHGAALTFPPGTEQEARALLAEGRLRCEALCDDWLKTPALHYLATIAMREHDYEAARKLSEETLVSARQLGDTYRVSRILQQLAEIALAQRNPIQALHHLRTSIALTFEQGRIGDIGMQLRLLAIIEIDQARPEHAVRFYAAASRLEGHATTIPPDDRTLHEQKRETLRSTLGGGCYEAEWNLGASISLAQAVAWALAAPPP